MPVETQNAAVIEDRNEDLGNVGDERRMTARLTGCRFHWRDGLPHDGQTTVACKQSGAIHEKEFLKFRCARRTANDQR
jgi:hypothetical protein